MEKLGIECKKLMAEEIKERLKKYSSFFITSFNSMAVSEQEVLRKKLKEVEASLFVVKNRIAKRAFNQLNWQDLAALLKGPTAIALGGDNPISVSKALVDFANKNENFKILGAYVDNQILDLSSVKTLASIPSKEILLTRIVREINLPIQGLVNVLSATMKRFVMVLDQIRQNK